MRGWLGIGLAACGTYEGSPTPATLGDTGSAPTATPQPDPTGPPTGETASPPEPTREPIPPLSGTHVRVLHGARGLGPVDLVWNGQLPPILPRMDVLQGTPFLARAAGEHEVALRRVGAPLAEAFATLPLSLATDARHSVLIYGDAAQPRALTFLEDDVGIFGDEVRIRWTHVALEKPTLDLFETRSGDRFVVGLGFEGSVEVTHPAGPMDVGLDEDRDGIVDVVFQTFDLTAGTYVHVVLLTEPGGAPFLIAHQPSGTTPRRDPSRR